MDTNDSQARLSRLETRWTLLFQAHQEGRLSEAIRARNDLVLRYYGAIYRYLLGMLGDAAAAEELTQEFAVAFLNGNFAGADAGRGRFRDYLRTSIRHLAHKYWEKKRPQPLTDDQVALIPSREQPSEDDSAFLESWKATLLARAYDALERRETETGVRHFSLLDLATRRPDLTAAELGEQLGPQWGKTLSADAVRQALHRARVAFAELLLEEVSRSLEDPSRDVLEEELVELGFLSWCQPALERRRPVS